VGRNAARHEGRSSGERGMTRISLSAEELAHLIELRRARRMRIKVLARHIGVAPKTLQHWQMGCRRPTVENLLAWRNALSA
jgi:DNA-binding transcriptional regulator YiaG